jgi:cation transport ATPase
MYSVIEDVSAVFDKIGGAFADSFGNEKTDDASAVIIDSVVHRGVKATVGAKKYTIGSDEYLAQCGILVSGYSDKSFTESVAGGVVLHVALEGVEILKLYVTYSIEPAFAEMAKQLSARGIKTVLRSTDPYIDEDLLANLIGELENPIRVIKTAESDSEAVNTDTVDGSLLANDLDWTALLKVKDAGESLNKWTKLNAMIGLGLLAAGVLIASFLGALGASVGLSPLYVVLFQLIAILPSAVISKLLLD